VTFSHRIEDIVQVVEAVGVLILVAGGLVVLVRSALLFLVPLHRPVAYAFCRRHLGRVILLGLEVLIVADIIRTVIVDQTAASVAVLATIVFIRIVLSWTLAVEVDGTWPWKKAALDAAGETETGDPD
jgi:uncharacterized membrane protein